MSKTLADDGAALSPGDFEEIERAVMETPRGRWFLAEYAKRLRHSDSDAMLAAMAKLHAAIAANQDEIIQRLAQALEVASAVESPRPAVPAQTLHDRQMKYFADDEDLFEPATAAPTPSGLSHPALRHLEAVHTSHNPPDAREAPASGASAGQPAAEMPRRRIVIIRHKPGETIDVPLQQELAESA